MIGEHTARRFTENDEPAEKPVYYFNSPGTVNTIKILVQDGEIRRRCSRATTDPRGWRICICVLCTAARPYDILTPLYFYLFLVYIEEQFIKNG
jgi:hypothetical protein